MDSVRGQLLVAAPTLHDPNFLRTVILVAEHGQDGALGVVLNRRATRSSRTSSPTSRASSRARSRSSSAVPCSPAACSCSPSSTTPRRRRCRCRATSGSSRWRATSGAQLRHPPRTRLRRHAGWGPGQLDEELAEEAWFVAPFHPEDAFCEDPDALWARALQRMGGAYALLARMPLDPSLN